MKLPIDALDLISILITAETLESLEKQKAGGRDGWWDGYRNALNKVQPFIKTARLISKIKDWTPP
jgi:hypothetical protein